MITTITYTFKILSDFQDFPKRTKGFFTVNILLTLSYFQRFILVPCLQIKIFRPVAVVNGCKAKVFPDSIIVTILTSKRYRTVVLVSCSGVYCLLCEVIIQQTRINMEKL